MVEKFLFYYYFFSQVWLYISIYITIYVSVSSFVNLKYCVLYSVESCVSVTARSEKAFNQTENFTLSKKRGINVYSQDDEFTFAKEYVKLIFYLSKLK